MATFTQSVHDRYDMDPLTHVKNLNRLRRLLSEESIEDRHFFELFTADMKREMEEFGPLFSQEDLGRLFACKDPRTFLFRAGEIISRIRGEDIFFEMHRGDESYKYVDAVRGEVFRIHAHI